LISFGGSNDRELIDRVHVRANFITVPIAFESEIYKKDDKKSIELSFGLNTNFNISQRSEVSFDFSGFPPDSNEPFDIEEYETEIKSYYLESVRKVTFKAYSSVGLNLMVARRLRLLLDSYLGVYLQAPNDRIMNSPIVLGFGASLRYDL